MATFVLVWILSNGDSFVIGFDLSWDDCAKAAAAHLNYHCQLDTGSMFLGDE